MLPAGKCAGFAGEMQAYDRISKIRDDSSVVHIFLFKV